MLLIYETLKFKNTFLASFKNYFIFYLGVLDECLFLVGIYLSILRSKLLLGFKVLYGQTQCILFLA
jgi:hypothetical protein